MIPGELKKRKQWVNWRSIERSGKATKVPFQPDGRPAKSSDPRTWSTFESLADGLIGFVFAQDDPYIGIDLDGCRNPETGKLDEWAREIVLRFGSYAEVSPSETGVKIFAISDSIWKAKNKVELDGAGHGGKKPGIEVYDCGRYFAVTGKALRGHTELVHSEDQLDWLAEKYAMQVTAFGIDGSDIPSSTPLVERAEKYLAKMEPAVAGQRGHDKCFKAACALVLGFGLSTDDAYGLLATTYNNRCDPPWNERELRHKVESANIQPGQRRYLADASPKEWSKIFVRAGDAPMLDDEETADDPVGVRRTLLHDAAMNHIEQVVDGEDDLFETGIPELDYAVGGGVAPGEMVIVAARPSHGKSAIALQMVHHANHCGIPAVVVSEEMSALALGKRTVQFATDVPNEHWKTKASDVLSDVESHFRERADTTIIESCGTADRVCQEVEKSVTESGAKVVVVDYVQLLAAKGGSRYEQVTAASQAMRRLASRLNIVLIVLAQLNRSIEDRKRFMPVMSDLKETGQLEQDADVIVFGVWPHRIDAANPSSEYQFFIGKNRNRAINSPGFKVIFEPSRQRMIEAATANFHSEFEEYGTHK